MRHRSMFVLSLLAGLCVDLAVATDAAAQQLLTCQDADTLDALATCIMRQMPRPQPNFNPYVPPSAAERDDFANVVTRMMNGECNFALPASLAVMPFGNSLL